jgi:hypothetical protein
MTKAKPAVKMATRRAMIIRSMPELKDHWEGVIVAQVEAGKKWSDFG